MNQLIAYFIFDVLIGFIGYSVARLVLPCLSLGKVYAEPLSAIDNEYNILGYRHDGHGRIEICATIAGAFGVIFAVVLTLCAVLIPTLL